jgi:hydrogenase expression/formation protein HypE
MKDIITMAHGAGGESMRRLLADEIAVLYDGHADLDDAAIVPGGPRLAVTTDSFVISPLTFPGGDVGKLAAAGTINDLCMRGATPLYMTVGLILEEGLPMATLRLALSSLRATCDEAAVAVIAGDTKVVQRGKGDGLFVNTTGVGMVGAPQPPSSCSAVPGDRVLVSGYLGDHGVAVLAAREDLPLRTEIASDCAPLHGLVAALISAVGSDVHVLRDPTRGGLASALNEIAADSAVGIMLEEEAVPVRPQVRGVCEILGLDPLCMANEGKLIACVAPSGAAAALEALRSHPLGQDAAIVGEVIDSATPRVQVTTGLGTGRVLSMPAGELLPRIC